MADDLDTVDLEILTLLARDGLAIAAALFASTIAAVIVSGVIAASGASTARTGELAP